MAPHDPRTAAAVDVVDLERLGIGAWLPDDLVEVDGWWLRASEGFTGRGNSALALAHPGDDLDHRLAEVADFYGQRGLPTWVAVPLPTRADLHADLLARGWTFHHGGRVLVRDLHAGAGRPTDDRPGRVDVTVDPAPDPAWLSRYRSRGGDLPEVGRRMLRRGEAVGFATVRDGRAPDDEVVAIGRGSVVDGWLGINAVETAPSHRRRGLATEILAALVDWAGDRGAAAVFLQVDLANDPARSLYERAGFVEHHTYEYLVAPPSP